MCENLGIDASSCENKTEIIETLKQKVSLKKKEKCKIVFFFVLIYLFVQFFLKLNEIFFFFQFTKFFIN